MDGRRTERTTAPDCGSDAGPPPPPASEPSAEPAFGRVLAQVLLVQLAALGLLWALQAAYHR